MLKPPQRVDALLLVEILWKQFCAGDNAALGKLAEQFYRPLLNYGLRLSTDRELLKDLLQELFLELWTRRHTLPLPDDVKAYLMGAFRNKIYKERIRANRLPQQTELPFEGNMGAVDRSVEELLIQDETGLQNQQRIQRLLATLPKRQQEVIYLHFYEGLDADQVAAVMAIGRQSVYNLLSRTLKDLRMAWSMATFLLLALFGVSFLR